MDSSAKRRQTNNSSGVGLDANNNPSPERRCRRSPSPTPEQLMMRREYIPLQDPRIAKLRQQEAQAPSEAIPAPSTAESRGGLNSAWKSREPGSAHLSAPAARRSGS